MKGKMKKSVLVILNYNDFDMCRRLLEKVKAYTVFDKIILVDNCSTDDSYIKLKEAYASVKFDVIQAPNNGGYAKGNNFGVFYAIKNYSPDIVYISNPDVLFEEEAVERMAYSLMKNAGYAVIAPLVRQGFNVWKQPRFWSVIESLFLVIFNMNKSNIKRKLMKEESLQCVGVVEGSFFAITAEAFRAVGGFDERTFLYYEENILGYRLKQCDFKTGVLPLESYEHLHSQSIKKEYNSKAKAFKNFYPSVKLYLTEYLNISPRQGMIFEVAYKMAYFERILYDIIKKINLFFGRGVR